MTSVPSGIVEAEQFHKAAGQNFASFISGVVTWNWCALNSTTQVDLFDSLPIVHDVVSGLPGEMALIASPR